MPVESKNMETQSLVEDLEKDKKTVKRQAQEDALNQLASGLSVTFQKYVANKEPIEDRMLQDYTQYHGQDNSEQQQLGFNELPIEAKGKRSKVFVNITRSKSDSAEARLVDMLFPTDDRNWEIRPTPVPEIAEALKNKAPLQLEGQEVINADKSGEKPVPMTESDLAVSAMEDAKTRSGKMQKEIDDQLVECSYNEQSRMMIRDGIQLGTGIMKGPMVVGKVRRAWVPKVDKANSSQVHILEIQEVVKPYVYRVSPWNFFPDMGVNDIRDAEKTFEVSYKTKKQMKEYLKTPGFMETQVKHVLESDPKDSHVNSHTVYLDQMRALAGISSAGYEDNRYQVIEYHGPLDNELLSMMGVDIDEDDPLEMHEGFVWFVGDTVIKIATHHLDTEDKLYSVFNWKQDDACVFGYGVPFELRAPQKVINASWRMIMDNAGLSTGPQIIINREIVEPADGDWELSPRKVWYLIDEDADVNRAFKTFNIESHQNELMQIFTEAKKLADEETNLPMVSQGVAGTVGRSAQGMGMAMNASNITMRTAVKNYDDDIAVPVITRFYDWNMQFSENNAIKGDYDIKALGASSLMVKDMQSQGLLAIAQYIGHEIFGHMLKADDLLRMLVKSLHVDPDIIVKSKETIKQEEDARREAAQNAEPQVTPDTQAKIEAQKEIALIQSEDKRMGMQSDQILAERKSEEVFAAIASKENLTMAQVRTRYEVDLAKVDWDVQKFYDELAVKKSEGSGI